MDEPKIEIVSTRVFWPRWYRNPIRWWRFRRMVKRHEKIRRDYPIIRRADEDLDRAVLFGDDPR